MKSLKKKRILIILFLIGIALSVLIYKLFNLTISNGEYYRDLSDNRKIKEIDDIAARGDIYDRNGELLATSIPSFAVELYKDEIMNMTNEEKIKQFTKLSKILLEEGLSFDENFIIQLNSFTYKDKKTYFKEKKVPTEKVIDIIVDNNLLYEILSRVKYEKQFLYSPMDTALQALKKRGISLPVETKISGKKVQLNYRKLEKIDTTLDEYEIDEDENPKMALLNAINNDKSVIRTILENPIAREIVYEVLKENKLQDNIVLSKYAIKNDIELVEKKANLSKIYNDITLTSNAKKDFYNIVLKSSLEELLQRAKLSDDGSYIIPAEKLIEKLEEDGKFLNLKTEIEKETSKDSKIYKVKVDFINPQEGDPVDLLIAEASKKDLLFDLITDEDVKYIAQAVNSSKNIYPSIDVDDWEYTFEIEKDDTYEYFNLKEEDLKNAKDAFEKILNYSDIKPLNKYIDNSILAINNSIRSQGSYGYQPVNLVYNLTQRTVAKIEENINTNNGIDVETVPIRYYPNRNSASHILGYIGNIATDEEINDYVKEKGYLKDQLIGKTGIEQSYEETLKGKNGKKIVSVDSQGNRKEELEQTKSVPGNDVYLSIDSKLQENIEDDLSRLLNAIRTGESYESDYGDYYPIETQKNAGSGAVVVTDVKTGEVLSMVSLPDYDPNLFSTGISSSDWESLQVSDESNALTPRPLLNIASQTAVMPGSTFKVVTSLAALQKGLDPHKTNYTYGYMDIGNQRFSDLYRSMTGDTHGEENLYDALKYSSNYYFYTLALGKNPHDDNDMGVKLELDDIRKAATELGLSQPTGIEIGIPAESSGHIPSQANKLETTKVLLKQYLDENLKSYLKKGTKKTQEEIDEDIEKIISWTEKSEKATRDYVINSLDKMEYEPLIEHEGEIAGLADTIKYSYLNQANWDIVDMLNIVIGQGQNSYTPLQMNRVMATISNGGNLYNYTLINSVKNHVTKETLFENKGKYNPINKTDEQYLEDIKYGTLQVAENNEILNKLPIDIGIKTGTAEVEGKNDDGSDYAPYSWMISYAPYDDPQIAVSILLPQGGTSYNTSALMRDTICHALGIEPEDTYIVDTSIENVDDETQINE
ncbi:MAG: penicillin-binding transpeptidase domain-containing protein [Peptoniphilaceae bacterium]|nr:penicillin-binding protein [Peptoniphilaceae bacterium]MDD7383320.1 penicillin-binding transpeptidase domain-containing protein [Peptoniphilaceae bacterium]MDY3738309.1 penicillin-binding transpeptidase domain-containing protein [Peptoniphilaceae bacterium]